ncbi:hypothetical protein ANTPLA_LOCUS8263 [Anthophora plagiata]
MLNTLSVRHYFFSVQGEQFLAFESGSKAFRLLTIAKVRLFLKYYRFECEKRTKLFINLLQIKIITERQTKTVWKPVLLESKHCILAPLTDTHRSLFSIKSSSRPMQNFQLLPKGKKAHGFNISNRTNEKKMYEEETVTNRWNGRTRHFSSPSASPQRHKKINSKKERKQYACTF